MPRPILVILALSAALAGCGGGGSKPSSAPQPTGKATPAAAKVAQRYLDEYTKHKAAAVCAELASPVLTQLKGPKGCVKQVKASFKVGTFPKLHVRTALANGKTATAVLRDSPRQITLTLEGGQWKILNGGT